MNTTYINVGGIVSEPPADLPPKRFREAWVRDGNAIGLDPIKQRAIFVGEVKAEAGRRILAAYPEHKQANANARATELTLIRAEGGTWTDAEATEAAVLKAANAWIKAIRARSNVLEAGDILSLDELRADATWVTS